MELMSCVKTAGFSKSAFRVVQRKAWRAQIPDLFEQPCSGYATLWTEMTAMQYYNTLVDLRPKSSSSTSRMWALPFYFCNTSLHFQTYLGAPVRVEVKEAPK